MEKTSNHSHTRKVPSHQGIPVAPPPNEQTNHTAVSGYYRIGATKVFPRQNHIACPDNSFIQLRPKSFDVLLHLCRKNGQLVEKETLVKAVWKDVCVTDDSLVQCIVEIRRALGSSNGRYLRTVTRLGYLIHAEALKAQPATNREGISMLVGPFRLLTPTDQSQFAHGLSDAITLQLLQSSAMHLQVLANTQHTDTGTADYKLSGSLQTQDARTRVALQLINLSTQQFVWAEVYEQQQADMFTLQDQLGETIAADVIAYLQQQQ